MSVLSQKHFHDEKEAYSYLEGHIWAQGRSCPHCGVVGESSAMKGKSTRIGAYKCYACRKPFTVKVGTIFEGSHIPLHKWLQAIFLLSSSKKGMSSNQLHRTLEVTLKTAWFMSHRIREMMKDGSMSPMGGEGQIVEADETYFGRRKGSVKRRGAGHKHAVISLVERGGKVRSFHVDRADKASVARIVTDNVRHESRLHTDESRLYAGADGFFALHETVNHGADEYARGDVTTNSVEGFFSIFKRGMKGIYQHCDEKHLHRYLNEYDFRYNNRTALGVNDETRAVQAIKGAVGKRLTYRTTAGANG
jgi:transposase-like protein